MTVAFTFPAPCERLSLNQRLHWARKAGITAAWRQAGHIYAKRSAQLFTAHHPSDVRVTFEVSDPNRRRDPSNAMPTVKALVDGITDSGLAWPDDNSDWVTIFEPRFVKGTPGRVMVEIARRYEPC